MKDEGAGDKTVRRRYHVFIQGMKHFNLIGAFRLNHDVQAQCRMCHKITKIIFAPTFSFSAGPVCLIAVKTVVSYVFERGCIDSSALMRGCKSVDHTIFCCCDAAGNNVIVRVERLSQVAA
jgi:uncharacterized repeat protein (TIGR04076 family)